MGIWGTTGGKILLQDKLRVASNTAPLRALLDGLSVRPSLGKTGGSPHAGTVQALPLGPQLPLPTAFDRGLPPLPWETSHLLTGLRSSPVLTQHDNLAIVLTSVQISGY